MSLKIRDRIQDSLKPHLRDGEQVQAVFVAARANPMWILVSTVILLIKGYYAVAATDQRILVFRTSAFAMSKLKQQVHELPRSTRFGELNGTVNAKVNIAGEDTWVHRRFWDDVRTADSAAR